MHGSLPNSPHLILRLLVFAVVFCGIIPLHAAETPNKYNVLFIISDDLTATALSCYGSKVCQTPNIDRLAESGVRFTRAYCQGTYCGPSRASFMSGYYPHAINMLGYKTPRPAIGDLGGDGAAGSAPDARRDGAGDVHDRPGKRCVCRSDGL